MQNKKSCQQVRQYGDSQEEVRTISEVFGTMLKYSSTREDLSPSEFFRKGENDIGKLRVVEKEMPSFVLRILCGYAFASVVQSAMNLK